MIPYLSKLTRLGVFCLALCITFAGPPGIARGVVVPAGGGPVVTPGTNTFAPGTIIADDIVSFTIFVVGGAGPVYFQGSLQRRVVRQASGDLAFGYRVRDTVGGFNGVVRYTRSTNFTGAITDGDYETTSPGARTSQFMSRSADGGTIEFDFGTAAFPGPNDSKFNYVKTNARFFSLTGTTQVVTTSGQFATIPTYRPIFDSTPPTAIISGPSPLLCVCNPVTITGTATDPDGTFASYTLDYAPIGGGAYVNIVTSNIPVVAGVLGVWNTGPVAQGYYFVRLRAFNAAGLSASDQTILFVDKQFDTVDVRSPGAGGIYGGTVCFDGTVEDGNGGGCFDHYTVDYAPLPAAAPFNPVNPASPVYNTPVRTDPLAQWNTRAGGAAVADGNYRTRVIGTDDCGFTRTVNRDVVIDNTAPIAVITSPSNCTHVNGVVPIIGTASDAHMGVWSVQYTGGDAHGWVTINSGNANVVADVLANWDTAGLRPCPYVVRLIVSDGSTINCGPFSNVSEYTIAVIVGCAADFNGSGAVSVQDIFDFLAAYFAGC